MSHPRSTLLRDSALLVLLGGGALLALCFRPARALAQDPPTTRRVSVGANGTQAGGESAYPAISADGRFVVFSSSAANLVAGDANQAGDIFAKDCTSGAILCASVTTGGLPAFGESYSPSVSGDGQRVAFASEATDLIAGDSNALPDVFVRDIAGQSTTRISVSQAGIQADGASAAPRISADGRFVAFVSHATNMVSGDTNGQPDVFVRDLQAGTLERISAGATGEPADGSSEGAAISTDGRFVAFASTAMNLLPGNGGGGATRLWEIYLRDRVNGTTIRVSVDAAGLRADGHCFAPALSADGRFVAFASHARNLASSDLNEKSDIYVRDLQSGTTLRASTGIGGQEPAGESLRPSISGDGRFVVFESSAGNLVSDAAPAGSTWIYLRDLVGGLTSRVIAATPELSPVGGTVSPAISGDGHWIAFSSAEPALVSADSNGLEDVFVRGPLH